jgi:L-ascorbate metabolism protein UlaG (beta-lactamase superfamily)
MHLERIHWYGHDAFRIEDGECQIYIDPWEVPPAAPKADLILITHAHHDHYSPEDVAALTKPGTRALAPADVAAKIGPTAAAIAPGQTVRVGNLSVRAVPAYNVDKKFHPRENGWVGYVITLADGMTIYHAGDTDRTPEMDALCGIDVALLPVSGTYVMTADEALAAARTFRPRVVIPMHYGKIVGSEADAHKFAKCFKGATIIKQPEK